MDVYIYKNTDDKRKLNKTLSVQRSVIADIKGTCSITAPTLILSYQGVDFNYIFVPTWSRYYFVTDIAVTTGGRVEVRCKVDVLMSNIDEILNLNCLILRQENETLCNKYLVDNKMFANAVKEETVESFGEEVITNPATCFLLTIK